MNLFAQYAITGFEGCDTIPANFSRKGRCGMKMSGKIGFGVAGLTAMLAFAVNAALPSGYTELEYVD